MGTIGIVNATGIKLLVLTSAGPPPKYDAVAHATSGTLGVTQGLRTSVNKDDGGWEKSLPAARSWNMSGDSEFAFDAEYGVEELYAAVTGRTLLKIRFSTEESNDFLFEGYGYLESLEMSGNAEENVTYSYSFKGTSTLTKLIIATIDDEASDNVTDTAADVEATVNPHSKSTVVEIEWGEDTEYGNEETCAESPVSGSTAASVTASLSGLTAETTYHWRVKATNEAGVVYGGDQTFTTLAE